MPSYSIQESLLPLLLSTLLCVCWFMVLIPFTTLILQYFEILIFYVHIYHFIY